MITGSRLRLVFGRANKAIEKVDKASISGTGLNITDFMIMEALLNIGPLPINTIALKVLLTSGSMTAAANRLEKKEFVQRIKDPADGRSSYLHLTKKGRRLIKAAYHKHTENLEQLAGGLQDEERKELFRLLKKIGKHAENLTLG